MQSNRKACKGRAYAKTSEGVVESDYSPEKVQAIRNIEGLIGYGIVSGFVWAVVKRLKLADSQSGGNYGTVTEKGPVCR